MLVRMPKCCGRNMKLKNDIGHFLEVQCNACRDIVYVKKSEIPKPQMIDD